MIDVEKILARRSLLEEDFNKLKSCLDLELHPVCNKGVFQDYELKEKYQEEKTLEIKSRTIGMHKVTRLPNPVTRLIVSSAVAHTTGNALDVTYSEDNAQLIKKIEEVVRANKEQSLNANVCESMFAFREVAEIWYLDEESKDIRCHIVSPLYGDTLYPEIDRLGRMQSFAYSNSFTDENGDEVTELVHYTAKETTIYQRANKSKDWAIVNTIPNIWGKIPVVYHNQGKADYEDVISHIYRLGQSDSDLSESVRNTAYPDKILTGTFLGVTQTPGRGGVYQTNGEADIKIAESAQGSNLIELEGKRLEEAIYTYTQTPNLSQSNVLKIGALSGEAIKRLYTPAILKVLDKRKYLDTYFTRRYNIVKMMVCKKYSIKDNISIEVEVTPYYPKDLDADIDRLIKMSAFMPKRYIVEEFKRLVNPSIDVDEVMKWFKEESSFTFGGSLMSDNEDI